MDKKFKLERLLSRFESVCIKLDDLPMINDEYTKKAVDEQYKEYIEVREAIFKLVCG